MRRVCTLLCLLWVLGPGARAAGAAPIFSLDPASPAIDGVGLTPDDLVGPGPAVLLDGSSFGLSDAFAAGTYDDLDALSFGQDVIEIGLEFSVDRNSIGVAGTPVRAEAPQQAADIYRNLPLGTHSLLIGEGALGLTPGFFGDDVDALAHDDDYTASAVYFSLTALSATGGAGDIYLADGASFAVWATGASDLGLTAGDDIDALMVLDTENPGDVDANEDRVLFSLSPFSPSVLTGGFSAADVFLSELDGSFTLYLAASDLGLRSQDNVDALRAIPEPSTLLLVGMGALGLTLSRRNRPTHATRRTRAGRAAAILALVGLAGAGLMGPNCVPFAGGSLAIDEIVVTEVLFGPSGLDSEFVELQNVTAVPQDLDAVWFFDASTGLLENQLEEAQGLDNLVVGLGSMESGDLVYAGRESATFSELDVVMGDAVNAVAAALSAEYWDGAAWTALALTDGTDSSGATLAETGQISWVVPGDWAAVEVGDETAFYIRLSVSATLSGAVDVEALDYVAGSSVDAGGLEIENALGDTYIVPATLPLVPPDAIVLVVYDGLGAASNDEDFAGDDLAVLHTEAGLSGDVFADGGDAVGLYTGFPHDDSTLRDQISWGPGGGTHGTHYTIPNAPNSGFPIAPGDAIGREPPFSESIASVASYAFDEVTGGLSNLLNRPRWFSPAAGSSTSSRRPVLAWRHSGFFIKRWQLQCDDDANFSSPIIDVPSNTSQFTPTADLPLGTLHCRVRSRDFRGRVSLWTVVSFTIVAPPGGGGTTADLGLGTIQQRRDSQLVCLLDQGAPFTTMGEKGAHAWDAPHPVRGDAHDNMYCCRAAIDMVATYYGGSLTQDRIAYECYNGRTQNVGADAAVNDDLGHGVGMWPTCTATSDSALPPAQQRNLLEWSLGQAAGTVTGIQNAAAGMGPVANQCTCPDCAAGAKPTFAQVKSWIDGGRPLIWVTNVPFHCHVIDGYTDPDGTPGNADDLIHVLNPWPGTETQVNFAGFNYGQCAAVFVPPVNSVGLSDESSVSADPDNDGLPRFVPGKWEARDYASYGLMSFDEQNRFNTNPNNADSDADCVKDKVELWSYVFGSGRQGVARIANLDGDANRAELDSDGDGGGTQDGLEDGNLDGDWDRSLTQETDPFFGADDGGASNAVHFQGTSPPVGGVGGGASWGAMTLRPDREAFKWSSGDEVLGEIATGRFFGAGSWVDMGGDPKRVVFDASRGGVDYHGDVLFGDFNQAIIDVTKGGDTVRFLLTEGCPSP